MTMRDNLRKLAHTIRAIPGRDFGLRPYAVAAVVSSWSGSVVGEGTETVTTTAITEADGQPPKVRWLTGEELALGGFESGMVEVGPITPDFPGGGTLIGTLKGDSASVGELLHFTLTGPEYPSGARYALHEVKSDRALHYKITLSPVAES